MKTFITVIFAGLFVMMSWLFYMVASDYGEQSWEMWAQKKKLTNLEWHIIDNSRLMSKEEVRQLLKGIYSKKLDWDRYIAEGKFFDGS